MQFYLKIGKNSRIIRPGDFFIGLNNQNYTYEDVVAMPAIERSIIGIYDFPEDNLNDGFNYHTEFKIRDIEEVRNMRIYDKFMFRDEPYTCSARDIYVVNSLLAIANINPINTSTDPGNLNWLNSQVPFFWYNADRNIRNMDIATFRDFAKNMTLHILSHNLAANVIQERVIAGEEVDIRDDINWPVYTAFTDTNANNYELFAKKLIELKYGSANNIDSDYQNQIDDIASMLE